jgi:hypothetical protein
MILKTTEDVNMENKKSVNDAANCIKTSYKRHLRKARVYHRQHPQKIWSATCDLRGPYFVFRFPTCTGQASCVLQVQ